MRFCTLASAIGLLTLTTTAAEPGYVPGQVLVKLNPSVRGTVAPGVAGGIAQFGLERLDEECRRWQAAAVKPLVPGRVPAAVESGADMLYLVSFDPRYAMHDVAAGYNATGLVEYTCPNAVLPVAGGSDEVPNDPRYSEQWHLPRIRAPQAWDIAHGDRSVIVAVIDDGPVWTREDIRGNLWVNVREDINGNGRFDTLPAPDGDLDGVDQDGNGYVDDVIGFDFLDGDPNPMASGSDDHGTACWGVANAVTDNDTGLAAPPWNVRGMALRCGGGGFIYLAAAISAIYYGIGKGAWVYSMSFGGRTPYPPLDNACQDLWSSGGISVASVGSSNPTYPAAYENVIAVTASDRRDYRASFAGYGTYVDVCAPGVEILTTSRSGYMFYDGTSLSTALTAGVLAWYKSACPGITNDSALALLYDRCDSMPDPLYPQGLLGHGRIAMVDSVQVGVEAIDPRAAGSKLEATVVRGRLVLPAANGEGREANGACLLDAAGQKVMELRAGANDVRHLASGVYFARAEPQASSSKPQVVRKVVVVR